MAAVVEVCATHPARGHASPPPHHDGACVLPCTSHVGNLHAAPHSGQTVQPSVAAGRLPIS
jgi:hypothetical protein